MSNGERLILRDMSMTSAYSFRRDQDPYAALAFPVRYLMANEGLFLAAAKTRVHSSSDFIASLAFASGEDTSQAAESAAEGYCRKYTNLPRIRSEQ